MGARREAAGWAVAEIAEPGEDEGIAGDRVNAAAVVTMTTGDRRALPTPMNFISPLGGLDREKNALIAM